MSYWAAELGSPTSVKAVSADGAGAMTEISPPTWATIEYEFPARNGKKPVKYVWYDGYKDAIFDPDKWALVSKIDGGKIRERNLPPQNVLEGAGGDERSGYGSIIIGTEGKMWFNRSKENWYIKPGSLMDGFDAPEQTIPRARGQDPHNEFFDACKAGKPEMALSGFAHSGPFTEMVLLGNLAVRLDKKVKWDGENLKSPNTPEADALVKRDYRKGWELTL